MYPECVFMWLFQIHSDFTSEDKFPIHIMCFWQMFREACPLKKAFPYRLLSQGSSEVQVLKCRDLTPLQGSPLTLYSPMCIWLLTYVTSFMYSNRWLMDEIFPTVFTVTGSLTFEFSGGRGGLSRVFSEHKQHSWSCPHVSSLVWRKEWPTVEGFSPFTGFLIGCELSNDCRYRTCGERLFYIHYTQLCVFTLTPTVCFYITPNCIVLYHTQLFVWMNELYLRVEIHFTFICP